MVNSHRRRVSWTLIYDGYPIYFSKMSRAGLQRSRPNKVPILLLAARGLKLSKGEIARGALEFPWLQEGVKFCNYFPWKLPFLSAPMNWWQPIVIPRENLFTFDSLRWFGNCIKIHVLLIPRPFNSARRDSRAMLYTAWDFFTSMFAGQKNRLEILGKVACQKVAIFHQILV